jgi:LPPG:FO 2-phospho-L-lactate transferase
MMRDQGLEASALGVAKLYADFVDVMVIDNADAELEEPIRELGMEAVVTDTIMSSMEKKAELARTVIGALGP